MIWHRPTARGGMLAMAGGFATFAVLNINVEREVTLEVFDLAGRRVRQLTETRTRGNGSYAMQWDETDESGALVPPGTYLLKAAVDSDANASDAVRVVGLVY